MTPTPQIHNIFFSLSITLCGLAHAAEPVKSEIMVTADGYAIHGFDVVAYFTDGEAVKGKPAHSAIWQSATWLFARAEHRQVFIENPDKYAPQYGGWCAYGMAEGYAAETDPLKAWTIHEGKLYLNWDEEVSSKWSGNINGYLKKSDKNWPGVQSKLKIGKAKVYWQKDEN